MDSFNFTDAYSNFTVDFSGFEGLLIASGVTHLLLVVIPAAIMGSIALAIILSDKKFRDPASILLVCITIQCILGPLTYMVY